MRAVDFFDKENGTTHGLDRPRLSDSAHNEYHSGDPSCGTCCDDRVIVVAVGPDQFGDYDVDEQPCPDCTEDDE